MFAEERQEQILELLKRNKRVSNTELIKKFGVSGTTIRIDLTELELLLCFMHLMTVSLYFEYTNLGEINSLSALSTALIKQFESYIV